MNIVHRALERIIDYAGLFPPAELSMAEVVARYDAYRRGPDREFLGRLIVPAARVAEMTRCLESDRRGPDEGTWSLSLLSTGNSANDDAIVRQLDACQRPRIVVESIEVKGGDVAEPSAWRSQFPDLPIYVELPLDDELERRLDRLAAARLSAKVRTGGVSPEAFPPADALARFITACVAAGVAFKATAGLHHPVRSLHAVTPLDARTVAMHGFINLLVATAAALASPVPRDLVARILDARDPRQFRWSDAEVEFAGDAAIASADLARARQAAFHSFGSCSFDEPLEDLHALELISRTTSDAVSARTPQEPNDAQ